MTNSSPIGSDRPDDPVYLHARREALVILGLWVAAMLWVVPYCYFFGYHPIDRPEQLKTIIGIPDWVFWGVFVPWLVCCLFSFVFSFWLIQDEDLEAE